MSETRSKLTHAQRSILDRFLEDPSSVAASEVTPAILRAIEEELEPTSPPAPRENFFEKRPPTASDLLTASEASQLLNISLNTFARSVRNAVESQLVAGRVLYRRVDLVAWGATRFAHRKRQPPRRK